SCPGLCPRTGEARSSKKAAGSRCFIGPVYKCVPTTRLFGSTDSKTPFGAHYVTSRLNPLPHGRASRKRRLSRAPWAPSCSPNIPRAPASYAGSRPSRAFPRWRQFLMSTEAALAQPPVAARKHTERTVHGHTLVDDYAWLREKENPEVIAYLEAENAYCASVFAGTEDLQKQL